MSRRRIASRLDGGLATAAVAAGLFLLALATLHMSPQGSDAWGGRGVVVSLVMCSLLPLAARRPVLSLGSMTGVFLLAQACFGLLPVLAMTMIAAVFIAAASDAAGRRSITGSQPWSPLRSMPAPS